MGELYKDWLKAAKDDLDAASLLLKHDNLTNIIAFHSQQAVEKSLKAVLEFNDEKPPKKHDLISIYKKASNFIDNIDENILDTLNLLYIESRYPTDLGLLPNGKPDKEEAEEFFVFAKTIYSKVLKLTELSQ
ncbi:MAG: HEPN domain-containing protein [Thermotogota bacterium]